MDSIHVSPASPGCGADVRGVDLGRLSNAEVADIRAAFEEHGLLFFRDQTLTGEEHRAFAGRWGEIDRCSEEAGASAGSAGWFGAPCCRPVPTMATVVLAHQGAGPGPTFHFADLCEAYDDLSIGLKRTLKGLEALHIAGNVPGRGDAQATHPVVIRHPETGRKALFLHPDCTVEFGGWTREESAPLLHYLQAHVMGQDYACRFEWTPGVVALWDNRRILHRPVADGAALAAMQWVTIAGEPLAA